MWLIEKCSSPTGDGNADWMIVWRRQRCIEKCSSPTGDGNVLSGTSNIDTLTLRNVVPRQGTEIYCFYSLITTLFIEKCSSPTGDGNAMLLPINQCKFIEKCSSPTGDGNPAMLF